MADKVRRSALVTWLAALIAPPTIAVTFAREFLAPHSVFAVVALVIYEIVVLIIGFLSGVVRRTASRWQDRLAERLDLAIQRKVSRFERQYRKFVLAELRFIDYKGLATLGPFTPELGEVFVDVSLVARPPQNIRPSVLPELVGDLTGRSALGDFLGRDNAAVLAVVGAPGSGKTTLLRHTARQACQRGYSRHGPHRDLPILLYLRDHVAAISADPNISIVVLLRRTLGDLAAAEPEGWLEQKLRGGECVALLDGLDEVAQQKDRRTVARWVERQISLYDGNDFVITSRPEGYRTAGIEGAEVLQVCGFTSGQVDRFVRSWYLAVERHSTGVEGKDIETRAKSGADDLLQRLDQSAALHDLTVNPLLLTMIANVHRYRGALPGSRAELYSEICQVMLWRRQEAKNLAAELGGDKKESVLRGLAYAMMERRVTDLSRDNVLAEIGPLLRRVSKRISTEAFLADVGSNGLLIERESELYSFAHQTFQEYLAAVHIRDRGLVSTLADAVNDPWWREASLLYAARSDADPIVNACLNANTVTALALAFDCADQDSEFDASLRDRLDELLSSVSDPRTDPERRRLMAGVMLTRHLRQQLRSTLGSRVCARPITNEIYRLFRADTQTPEPDTTVAAEALSEIAVGMRSSDAAAFVRWTNSVTHGSRRPVCPVRRNSAISMSISSWRLPHSVVLGSACGLNRTTRVRETCPISGFPRVWPTPMG